MPRSLDFLGLLRGVLLKGVGFEHLRRETAVLAAFALVLLSLSAVRFSKTIE